MVGGVLQLRERERGRQDCQGISEAHVQVLCQRSQSGQDFHVAKKEDGQ